MDGHNGVRQVDQINFWNKMHTDDGDDDDYDDAYDDGDDGNIDFK